MTIRMSALAILAAVCLSFVPERLPAQTESEQQHDARMHWWRDARFGLFIHWGLYAVPAGEWKGQTNHAEWIRETARIPVKEYEKFVPQFNPVKFNADEWVRLAKEAGMKYIVITSKHHDGFCLFDSKETDFDIMSTPFKRDIMKELSTAARKAGLKICWYHSIMDWHHPDYLPRRSWEEKDRPADGASFDRYVQYLKAELRELLTNYGPIGVLWFDGEWESTWNEARGRDLYAYVRSLQPDIIINNRVGAARSGMEGFTSKGAFAADFGTPEQTVPAMGLPGVDWESCMTMNDHWGFNKFDHNWKSAEELLRMLADIASKGGNLLLNVGPTSEGVFPPEAVERLRAIGAWMKVNGEAIYGTQASPFSSLSWGRCTEKVKDGKTTLYLHVFDWPTDRQLVVPALLTEPARAYLLSDAEQKPLTIRRSGFNVLIEVPAQPPDGVNSVVALELKEKPSVLQPPEFTRNTKGNGVEVTVKPGSKDRDYKIRYTEDGSVPTVASTEFNGPVMVRYPATLKAAAFYKNTHFGEVTTVDVPLSFGKPVKLTTPNSEKYKADGPSSLTDGLFGTREHNDGKWLGFEQDNMEAVVDLGAPDTIHSITLTYLVRQDSWIFAPTEISYSVSDDGQVYRPVGSLRKDPANWKDEHGVNSFSQEVPPQEARYIKVFARNIGVCPPDHAAKGGKAWLFVDEITVR